MDNTIREVFKVEKSIWAMLAKVFGKKEKKNVLGTEITIARLCGKGYIINVR